MQKRKKYVKRLTLKRLGRIKLILPSSFYKNVFFRESVKPWVLVIFNPNKTELFEGIFSGKRRVNLTLPSYFKKNLSNVNIT